MLSVLRCTFPFEGNGNPSWYDAPLPASSACDALSRLKGMETVNYPAIKADRDFTCDALSRLKGMETPPV